VMQLSVVRDFKEPSLSKFPRAKFTNCILILKNNFRKFKHNDKSKFGDC